MPKRLDPTRTTTLRSRYSRDMRRRFNAVRSAVIKAIGELDALGVAPWRPPKVLNQIVTHQLPEAQAWRFRTNAQKIESFKAWFQELVDENILVVDVQGDPWTAQYVHSAYKQGSIRAYIDTHREELADTPEFYQGSREQFLRSAFTQPERVSKLKFLYSRSFTDLKGITDAMSLQMSRILADGLSKGLGPRTIARNLSRGITAITRTRALTMARTEVIAAHAEGQLDSFEELGVTEVGLMAEWSTAGDDLVCPLCEPLDGVVMTVREARGTLPRHPNCRCAWIPANVGEKEKGQKRGGKAKTAIRKSVKAELPKRTRAGETVPQTVKEGKRRSTWAGKEDV